MIDSLSQSVTVDAVAGPDELWRAGLNGLSIAWLAQLAGAGSQNIIFAGNFMPDENATVLHTNAPDSLREKLTEAGLLI